MGGAVSTVMEVTQDTFSYSRSHRSKMFSCRRCFLTAEVSHVLGKELLFLISEVFLLPGTPVADKFSSFFPLSYEGLLISVLL